MCAKVVELSVFMPRICNYYRLGFTSVITLDHKCVMSTLIERNRLCKQLNREDSKFYGLHTYLTEAVDSMLYDFLLCSVTLPLNSRACLFIICSFWHQVCVVAIRIHCGM